METLGADGKKKQLCQTLSIAYFVSDEAFKGGPDDLSKAEVLQWLAFADQDLLPVIFNHVFPILDLMPKTSDTGKIQADLFRLLGILDEFLKLKTFLVGERISLADISVCFNLILLMERGLLEQDRDKFTYLMRWFNTIINQKNVKDVIGDIQLCEKLEALPKIESQG